MVRPYEVYVQMRGRWHAFHCTALGALGLFQGIDRALWISVRYYRGANLIEGIFRIILLYICIGFF